MRGARLGQPVIEGRRLTRHPKCARLRVPPGALVTPKDPKPYAERLAFHITVDSASEYGLDVGQ